MTSLEILHTTLKLLSDPTRLRLLALLAQEELAVQELVSITGLAQSRVSNHLSLLKRANLVRDRREGSWAFHSMATPGSDGALTHELFEGAVRPFVDSAQGQADAKGLEAVREARRERSRRTHDALADRWVELGQEFRRGSLRSEALAALAPRDLVVADLGCGAGYLSGYLADRAQKVIAVDHSSKMLDAAQRRLGDVPIEYRQGEFESLPLADDEVDAAFANLVWHHVADMDRAAVELLRVLKPGGKVVITDLLPHEEDWMREAMGDLRLGVQPDAVRVAMTRAGFTEVATHNLDDAYRVEAPTGREADLPMFLLRATAPV